MHLTEHRDTPTSGPDRPAHEEEIEVTPEMTAAGVSAALEFDSRYEDYDSSVDRIFRAMWGAMATVKTASGRSRKRS